MYMQHRKKFGLYICMSSSKEVITFFFLRSRVKAKVQDLIIGLHASKYVLCVREQREHEEFPAIDFIFPLSPTDRCHWLSYTHTYFCCISRLSSSCKPSQATKKILVPTDIVVHFDSPHRSQLNLHHKFKTGNARGRCRKVSQLYVLTVEPGTFV